MYASATRTRGVVDEWGEEGRNDVESVFFVFLFTVVCLARFGEALQTDGLSFACVCVRSVWVKRTAGRFSGVNHRATYSYMVTALLYCSRVHHHLTIFLLSLLCVIFFFFLRLRHLFCEFLSVYMSC